MRGHRLRVPDLRPGSPPVVRWLRGEGIATAHSSRDRGATLILFALLVTVLFVITALVVDYGFVRANRQEDKSSADFAAAAGIRGLDDKTGRVNVWKGICTAVDFLRANDDQLSSLSAVDSAGNPVTPDPCANLPTPPVYCDGPADWRTYRGVADAGRIRVTVQNGYELAGSGFAEDADEYADDAGDDPCEHLAVIIEHREDPSFGGVAGASGYETTMRSVARLDRGLPDITAALILLERNDCRVLEVSGTGASVIVGGSEKRPGSIHSDSLGNGANCNSKIYELNGGTPPPRIISQRAPLAGPDGSFAPGEISAVALTGAPGAQPGNVSEGVAEVCAQQQLSDCGNPAVGLDPAPRDLVTRSIADVRYLPPLRSLRQRAQDRFAITTTAEATAAGYAAHPCNAPGPFTDPMVWIDCPTGNKTFDGAGKVFTAAVEEVVINGDVGISGSNQTMHMVSPKRVFIKGASADAVKIGSSNNLFVNDGGVSDGDGDGFVCPERYANDDQARTEFVVGNGRVSSTGGVFRLCQTTLFMMDSSGSDPCPLPTKVGTAPDGNTCQGNVSVAGGAKVDWTAPNLNNVTAPEPDELLLFEDLALWSETSGAGGSSWGVGGSGGLHLGGIFVTPNADPFTVTGGGAIDIEDAQFVTRKLRVTGGGVLFMRPQPKNALQIPPLKGFGLVR